MTLTLFNIQTSGRQYCVSSFEKPAFMMNDYEKLSSLRV